jgi:hypothetical protein
MTKEPRRRSVPKSFARRLGRESFRLPAAQVHPPSPAQLKHRKATPFAAVSTRNGRWSIERFPTRPQAISMAVLRLFQYGAKGYACDAAVVRTRPNKDFRIIELFDDPRKEL